jgi:hypothetical protein
MAYHGDRTPYMVVGTPPMRMPDGRGKKRSSRIFPQGTPIVRGKGPGAEPTGHIVGIAEEGTQWQLCVT